MDRNIRSIFVLLTMILAVAACSSLNQVTPQAMDDEAIEAEIRANIAEAVTGQTFDIGIAVEDRVVTLTGTVDTSAQRQAIIDAAADVEGVRRIINNIQVR